MEIKPQTSRLFLIITAGLFGLIFLNYTVVDPVIVYNFDDWRYFGFFESDPIPRLGRWNVTRILPEYLLPLAGYFSAFVIYPFTGDYLFSSSVTLALLLAAFLSVLFIVSYRLFNTLCENKNISLGVSLLMMLLCFAIFKSNPEGNVHMFYADQYTLYCYYVLPNILNSIVTLILLRKMISEQNLSILNKPSLKSGFLLVGIYFSIFSMLYSAAILLAFAFSVGIYRLMAAIRQNKKPAVKIKAFFMEMVKNYNIVLIIMGGMVMAMILELQSGRSNAAGQFDSLYTGSLFSVDFLKRIALAAGGVIGWFKSINKYVLLLTALIVLAAAIRYYVKRRNGPCQITRLAVKCLPAGLFLIFFYSLVAAKGGVAGTGLIHCVYGVFFYLILLVCCSSLGLLREIQSSHLLLPFILTVLFMIVLNSTRWPYETFREKDDREIMVQTIAAFSEASDLGQPSIVLYVPADYPLPYWAVARLAWTLYYHKITTPLVRVAELKYSTDGSLYYTAG